MRVGEIFSLGGHGDYDHHGYRGYHHKGYGYGHYSGYRHHYGGYRHHYGHHYGGYHRGGLLGIRISL